MVTEFESGNMQVSAVLPESCRVMEAAYDVECGGLREHWDW